MENPQNHETNQRKQSLEHIKEYILQLLKKQQDAQSTQQKTKEAIESTLNAKNPKELEKNKSESRWDKVKNLVGWEDDQQDSKDTPQKWGFELPPEDQDEYIPQDSEFGESIGESPRFAEVYPPYLGYYAQGKKSYFTPQTNLWSKKKQLSLCDHDIPHGTPLLSYAGFIQAGITAIPLPSESLPHTPSLQYQGTVAPLFHVDQNNCVYLVSKEKQAVSFQFAHHQTTNNKPPVPEDTQNIIFASLTPKTEALLAWLTGKPILEQARLLSSYIKTIKKYNTDRQGTLRNTSNAKNYVVKLDESEVLECYSANTLLVALCRKLGIPARLVVGHMVQSVSKDGKAHLTRNNGHAWTEIRDGKQRLRLDATPTEKENGDSSEQNLDEQDNSNAESNMDEGADSQDASSEQSDKWKDESWKESEGQSDDSGKEEGAESWKEAEENDKSSDTPPPKPKQQPWPMTWPRDQKPQASKSAEQMLDEFIQKAKEDSLTAQWEQLTKALDQLENAQSKEEIKKILDTVGLTDFAKEEINKLGNQWILEQEKKELEKIDDEQELEKQIQKSLLDPLYKQKLKEYAELIKKKIEEQKQKMKSEMQRFGFTEQELSLYKQYKQLEQEVMPEVRRQIEELKRVLPPQYLVQRDEDNYYRSWAKLDKTKLVDRKVSGNNKIFKRSKIELDSQEINMFETIIIDRSGSMGSWSDPKSPFSQSVKAAITRAKVLEHFKVDMSIVIFDDTLDEVMNFGDQFSDRMTKIPSKLMRAYTARSWGNSQEPITYVYHKMKERMKQLGGKSFGNVSFIGDGDLYSFQQIPALKAMIDDLKKQNMWVTAYYINQSETKMPLIEYYFWPPTAWATIYAKDSPDLSSKIINNHKTKLNLLIKKYLKQS